jgi:hypothetical protein
MAGYIGSKSSVTLVDGYTEAEADAEFVTKTGDTMSGNLNVTGTALVDGLTVNGIVEISTQTPQLRFFETDQPDEGTLLRSAGDSFQIAKMLDTGATDGIRIRVDQSSGDISFYEDTGTTAKFHWDASAESLGIGTDTPDTLMELVGANPILTIRDTETGVSANDARLRLAESGASSSLDNYFDIAYVADKFTVGSNSFSDALTINRENGNVGIKTDDPTASLHITASGSNNLTNVLIESTDASATTAPDLALYRNSASPADNDSLGALWFYGKNSADEQVLYSGIFARSDDVTDGTEDGELLFYTRSDGAHDEAMRINQYRDLMVGNTTTPYTLYTANNNATKSGVGLRSAGYIAASRMDDFAMQLNRMGTDGDILGFRKNGTDVGAIGMGTSLYIDGGAGQAGLQFRGSDIVPRDNGSLVDNSIDLGDGAYRFDDIYAGNTSIIGTSDITEKQDIASLTATEMLVAARLSKLFKTFRWKDSVAEKGDNARTHTGTMAQEVQSSFTEEGLDAGDYSLFVSNTWWTHDVEVPAVEAVAEVTDEDGNVTTEAVEAVDSYTRTDTYKTEAEAPEGATSKTRLGLRYTELLAFVSAYNEQRFASIEARLTALEA